MEGKIEERRRDGGGWEEGGRYGRGRGEEGKGSEGEGSEEGWKKELR